MNSQFTTCPDCRGEGFDPTSTHYPLECPTCCGAGYLIHPDEIKRIARRQMNRAREAAPKPGYWEEQRGILYYGTE